MLKRSSLILRGLWVLLCFAVLAITIYGSGRPENRDNILVLTWAMFVLAFPSSVVLALIYSRLGNMLPDTPGLVAYVTFFLTWLAFFCLGYLQWFFLVPLLVRKFRLRREGSAGKPGDRRDVS